MMPKKSMIIVHIARIPLNYRSGMGRIASMWRAALENAGHRFHHIGIEEVPQAVHPNLWGFYARKYLEKSAVQPDLVLVHEPYGGFFSSSKFSTVVFSHGLEVRAWAIQKQYGFQKLSYKSLFFPLWLRFYANNRGIRKADLVMLSNQTDKRYLENKGINSEKLWVFQNGYYPAKVEQINLTDKLYILFNATWIERKGTALMYQVFNRLLPAFSDVHLILAGTAYKSEEVLKGFINTVHTQIEVIPAFNEQEELDLYAKAAVFVLPSYYEGQSLALTQAMAMGLCPIAAANCGQLDIIRHKKNGLLFSTGSAADFYEQLKFLLTERSMIAELGKKAALSVAENTWDSVSKQIVEKLESCCNQPSSMKEFKTSNSVH
jgi:glycosyltransferase involved in cell wall biosynthesis